MGGTGARLRLPALAAFASPGVCIGALAIALTVYLPRYYAGHLGLGLATVGLVFMVVRLVDMALDPLIGVMMDRTRSALGRYRPWLLLGAPVLAIPVWLLFSPPAGVGVAWLLGWLFVYYIGASLVVLAHASWASVIAADYHERSRVFGAIQVFGILGATLVLLIPLAVGKIASLGALVHGDPVAGMGLFVVVSAVLGIALAGLATREHITPETRSERFGLKDYWEMITRPDMARIIVADFCLAMGPGWMAALYLFYFHDARGFSIIAAGALLLIYVAAGFLGAIGLSILARRIGKHRTLMAASTGYSLGLVAMAFLPKGAFALAAGFMFVMGFLASSFPLLDRAMVADVGDAVRLQHGKHRVGLLYAMITTSQKMANALSIGLSFSVLGWIGYRAGESAVNTPAAI
ncbi:MAG: MFS transporter, partial [Caulobacteraceae bacterium]